MKTKSQPISSAAAAAALLAGNATVANSVENALGQCRMATMLLNLRVQRGLTQRQIASGMKCSVSKISKLESATDDQIKMADIVAFTAAAGSAVTLSFDSTTQPAAERIKQHVFAIHHQLESLAKIATSVGDDQLLVEKIHQFYGDVLFNFMMRFEDSYQKLPPVITIGDKTITGTRATKNAVTAISAPTTPGTRAAAKTARHVAQA